MGKNFTVPWCNQSLDLTFDLQIVFMFDAVVDILEGVGVEKPDNPVDGHKCESQNWVVDQGEPRREPCS